MNPDRLAELEEERTFLLRSLTDLEREHEAGDVDEADYVTLRDDYTARAASVLHAIEDGRAALPARRRISLQKVLAGAAVSVALAGAIFWALSRSVNDDTPAAASETTTAVALCPPKATDVNSLLVDGRTALGTDTPCAFQLFTAAFKADPTNVEAATYLGWVIAFDALSTGMTGDQLADRGSKALVLIDRARELDPTYPDAQCFTAIIRFRFLGDAAGAKEPLDACRSGQLPAEVAPLVSSLGDQIDAALSGSTTTAG